MNNVAAQAKIKVLEQKYDAVKSSGKINSYTEEDTKKGFIEPLFEILGWNIRNRSEVTAEEHQSSGRVDYGFYLDDRLKFYLEAKALGADLHREDFANQAVRYSWNKNATWAILTDFESIKVFNAQDIERSLADKLFFEIPYTQYLERFDQLWLLSKDSFKENLLDKEAEKYGKKLQKVSVTAMLYKDLDKCREILTDNLSQWNPKVDKDLLDEGVQKLLDRLIFLRVAEDRRIEPPTLIPLVREWDLKDKLYQSMVKKFREFDEVYNSNLFSEHPFEKWEEYSGVTEKVINILYGKKGYYEYDFKAMPADVLGGVYENYLGYRLNKSKKGLSVGKDAKKRKEHGIYYTPDFIVDYIVKNTLKPVLDKCVSIHDLKKIRVLDPACGSGSFLIKALEVIYAKYIEFGNPGGVYTKINILLENIYGVDLDPQAVEIARLNLLISALDTRMKLPGLDKNIKNGNSLISGTDEELKKYFGNNFRDKKPFNWQEEFPDIFKQGGFDVVIGNPPWVTINHKEIGADTTKFFKDKYKGAEGFKLNLFPMFVELALRLTKSGGIFSFIIPNRLLDTPSYAGIRKEIIGKYTILDIENLPKGSFDQVVAGNIILIIEKTENNKDSILIKNFHSGETLSLSITSIVDDPNLTININTKTKSSQITDKIDHKKILKLKDLCNIHVGMMVKNKKEMFKDAPVYKYKIVTGRDLSRYLIVRERYFDPESIEIFGGTKNKNKHLEYPKLFVRKTGNTIVCSIDEVGIFAEQSVYLVLLRNKYFDIKFLAAILNSKLITFYFKNKLITNPEAYPYIQHYDLENMPIVDVDKKQQKQMIVLVDKMLNLIKRAREIPENSNKWNSLKSEIEKTDKKIDEEVYKLYGLTKEEIEIVEGKNEKNT